MRSLVLFCLVLTASLQLHAGDGCMTIRGRAHYYDGDANLRIWHIGTHHEFEPDNSTWNIVMKWLDEGVKPSEKHYAAPESQIDLYADFLVCPVEPFKKGSLQKARILSATHRRYVHLPN